MPALFDPLAFLTRELHANVEAAEAGISLTFTWRPDPRTRQRAQAVVKAYEKLIRLQLENGGASIQKLMAWGKVRVEGGRYVVG